MTLNSRTSLMILPVIMLGYSLAFIGVYDTFRKMLVEAETAEAQMQVVELADSLTLYTMMLDQYSLAIQQHPDVRRLLSDSPALPKVQHAAKKAIADIGASSRYRLTAAALNEAGELNYIYRDGEGLGLANDALVSDWVGQLAAQGMDEASRLVRGNARILKLHRLQPERRDPAEGRSIGGAVALIAAIDAVGFKRRAAALIDSGKRIEWLEERPARHAGNNGFISVEHQVPELGVLQIMTPKNRVNARLHMIAWLLALAFVILGGVSYMALRWLLWRYIVQPINVLERELVSSCNDPQRSLNLEFANDEIGSLGRVCVSMQKELRKSYRIARDMAEKDGLTRLLNRRMFYYRIERLLERTGRDQHKVALLYIDIDNLKLVNDKFGMASGDELLRNFADRLSDVLRPGDLVAAPVEHHCAARLAGDEFAVLLDGYEDDDAPRRVAMRLFGICEQDYLVPSAPVALSLSIGVASYPHDANSATELIANADAALAQAKSKGGNQYSLFSRAQADKARRIVEIESALSTLPYTEFELYYMPIVSTKTSKVCGVEALLRWHSASLGWVSPEEFIPVAESMGAFRGIDRWVINQASADLPALVACFGQHLHVSVNISAAELVTNEFADEVSAMVQQGFISPSNIELEITETFNVDHGEDCDAMLRQLRSLGFSISIDDFGTGYTSMVQLVEYPVDKIKLDKTFLNKVLHCDRVEVVGALVDFCKSQSFEVTAEGIETLEQLVAMTEAGCDYLQGYYFSRPLPLSSLLLKYQGAAGGEKITPVADIKSPLRLVTA